MGSVSQKLFTGLGQAHEFELAMIKQGISAAKVQGVIDGRLGISFVPKPAVKTILPSKNKRPSNIVSPWVSLYKDLFGIRTVFPGIKIPQKRDGFDRLIIIAEGMTPQRLYNKCAELFPSWKWTESDLDEIVTSDRTAKNDVHGAYAIWVRDRVEADEELKSLSANQLEERKISGITLEERLAYELKYFKETGKHLDVVNVTLCAGSRYRDGYVPVVDFYPGTGKVGVFWTDPGHRDDLLCSRQVVSA